uniref:Uncharacterized protein n=1 Tax=Panagrolaimus davidi TaxID=227884 RepID=A0A914NXX9_9BILA
MPFLPRAASSFQAPDLLIPPVEVTTTNKNASKPRKNLKNLNLPSLRIIDNAKRRARYSAVKLRSVGNALKEAKKEIEKLKCLESENETLKECNQALKDTCKNLTERINFLEDCLATVTDNQTQTVVSHIPKCLKNSRGAFTPKSMITFGELAIRCSIPQDKVGLAILIISRLLDVEVDSVPSGRTVGRSFHGVSSVVARQISELLSMCENLMLMSDETAKFCQKFQAFIAAGRNKFTGEDILIHLGLIEVATKSAIKSFEALETIIKSIATTVGIDKTPFFENFIISIKSLYSDQAATQLCFNKILALCREGFLRALPAFQEMSEITQAQTLKVHSTFCLLHVIQNMVPVVLNVLLEHEKQVTGNPNITKSLVEWLITEIARYFGKRSAAKHRSARDWKTYCEKEGFTFYNICNLLGHRFNIIFVIAAQILLNKDKLIDFIKQYAPDLEENFKLASSLENPMINMHLHILATVDSKITGALWRLSENHESFLKTRDYAQELIVFFNRVVNEPLMFFGDEAPLEHFERGKPETPKSVAIREMLEDLDPVTGSSQVVSSLSPALAEYFKRQFEFQLGDDFNLIAETEIQGAPSNNRACEADFGFLDYLFKRAPNMTAENRNITILAIKNHVFEWLQSLPPEKYDLIINEAAAVRSSIEARTFEKARKLKLEIVEHMEQQAVERIRALEKSQTKKTKLQVEVDEVGFWKTIPEMEQALSGLSSKLHLKAVKTNIRYRKFVFQPNFTRPALFRFSKDGNNFSLQTLKQNLIALIEDSI